MVDNFDQIADMLEWKSDDEFYFVQILRRKKDLPDEIKGSNNSARLIKSYFINNLEHFYAAKDEIVKLCEVFTARAGINLNKRSYEKTALQTARTILDQVSNHEYKHARRAFNTTCGRYAGAGDKHWILDYDNGELSSSEKQEIREEIAQLMPDGDKVIDFIPTRAGTHIITKPFNIKQAEDFLKKWELDVHKNNPTILYIP